MIIGAAKKGVVMVNTPKAHLKLVCSKNNWATRGPAKAVARYGVCEIPRITERLTREVVSAMKTLMM